MMPSKRTVEKQATKAHKNELSKSKLNQTRQGSNRESLAAAVSVAGLDAEALISKMRRSPLCSLAADSYLDPAPTAATFTRLQ